MSHLNILDMGMIGHLPLFQSAVMHLRMVHRGAGHSAVPVSSTSAPLWLVPLLALLAGYARQGRPDMAGNAVEAAQSDLD